MLTDLDEVYRLGTARAKENLAFRRFLTARRVPEGPFRILAEQVAKQVDCTACANCCRHSVVSVTGGEIERIAASLHQSAEYVARNCTVADPDAPALRILSSGDHGCVFLERNLCTVYAARPDACRDFPHLSVGTHSLGGRRSSVGRWAPFCPIVFNALEIYKQRTGFLRGRT